MEYVKFNNKNWGYAGDKGTWAAFGKDVGGKTLTVKRANKGLVSEAYEQELTEFCAPYGIDFGNVRCGQTVKVNADKIKLS
jgi:hypothetical protein